MLGLFSKLKRLFSPAECRKVTDKHPDYFTFDVEDWFSKPENYALQEGDNIGFAGPKGDDGVYWLHFCFDTAKGREAINLTRRMVAQLFDECPIKIAIGLINEDNKKARWLIRQVGFTSLGMQETAHAGLCEMFYFVSKDNTTQ